MKNDKFDTFCKRFQKFALRNISKINLDYSNDPEIAKKVKTS
jgi:hypothetical protein